MMFFVVSLLAWSWAAEAMALPARRGPIPVTGNNIQLTKTRVESTPLQFSERQNTPAPNIQAGNSHYWFATISLGTQSHTFQMLVDTGSADLVFGNGVTLPDSDLSDQGKTCMESYGASGTSGSFSGEIYNGPYNVVGNQISGLFCVASSTTGPITGAGNGIMGLGMPPQSGGQTVASQTGNNVLTASGWTSFGLYYSSADTNGPGQLTPNGADPSFYQGEQYWQYETVLASAQGGQPAYTGHWQFGYSGYACNGATGTPAVGFGYIDSGNPTINLDSSTVQTIYNQLNAQGAGLPAPAHSQPVIDCSFKGAGPDVAFTFASGNVYTIPSSTYVLENGGVCHLSIIALASDSSLSVFGEPFIQQYYTWFDYKDLQLGFNPSKG